MSKYLPLTLAIILIITGTALYLYVEKHLERVGDDVSKYRGRAVLLIVMGVFLILLLLLI